VFLRRDTLGISAVIMHSTFSALTSPHHTNRNALKKKYSEVTIEKSYKEQNSLSLFFLSLFHCKQGNKLTCYVKTNCYHFVKIDNNNNESDIIVKTSQLGNGGESGRSLFKFSAQNDLPNNILEVLY
jgi:hypothetical protein